MFLPVVAFYLIFKYTPMFGLIIAFKNYTFYEGILGSQWVGLDNFNNLFTQAQSVQIIRNTLMLSVFTVFVGFPFPILLAILLNEVRRAWFKRMIQTLVYLPHFFSWVVVGGIVITLFSQSGVVNALTNRLFGGEPFAYLYSEWAWISIFLGSGIWKEAGFSAIIYLAALTVIEPSLYEAASIDGAGTVKALAPGATVITATYGSAVAMFALEVLPDRTPPAWSEGAALTAADVMPMAMTLHWPAAIDAAGVDRYELSMDGQTVAVVPGSELEHRVTGLSANKVYAFELIAVDAGGLRSAPLFAARRSLPAPPNGPSNGRGPEFGHEQGNGPRGLGD
nr:ABC transporter permease subunit [Paenibacillus sp.]